MSAPLGQRKMALIAHCTYCLAQGFPGAQHCSRPQGHTLQTWPGKTYPSLQTKPLKFKPIIWILVETHTGLPKTALKQVKWTCLTLSCSWTLAKKNAQQFSLESTMPIPRTSLRTPETILSVSSSLNRSGISPIPKERAELHNDDAIYILQRTF